MSTNELSLDIQHDLIDILTERPYTFTLNGKVYFLYHPSLGKVLLIQKELSKANTDFSDISSLCYRQRKLCCRILAYSVLCNRRQYHNKPLIDELAEEFENGLNMEGLGKLLCLVKSLNDTKELEKALGMNDDDDDKKKIAKSKSSKGSSVVFGGRSIYGNLIDAACQRYGWTLDYLLWDISFANVHFMLKDAISSVYLTEEERKELHLKGREATIDVADPKNKGLIARLLKD